MKKSVILLILILFGCMDSSNEKSFDNSELKSVSFEDSSIVESSLKKSNFDELNIIEEKLQELYDVKYLAYKNPNFKNKLECLEFTNIELSKTSKNENGRISNINPLTEITFINDSTKSVRIEYLVKFKKGVIKDTIEAIIHSKDILIDNQKFNTLKVNFKSN